MKQYNCLKAIPLSFYSASLYRDVAKNWGASTLFYIAMLVTVCSLFWTVAIQLNFNKRMVTDLGPNIDKMMVHIPQTTLNKDGTITTPENKPYILHDLKEEKIVMIIDTSGKYHTLEKQPFDILFTKSQYMVRKDNGEIEIKNFPKGLNYVLHPDKVRGSIAYWGSFLWLPMIPAFIFGGILWRLFEAFIYAISGKVLALTMGIKLSYYDIF